MNWLYRPADVKLPKGLSLDAAPNEIFYSFHKDEIPAASLLHPCKVAFLRKGVELPSSISSFVCRRVYDTDNKCLWWLTDRDYINVSISGLLFQLTAIEKFLSILLLIFLVILTQIPTQSNFNCRNVKKK